ncbi:hypothetical protein GGR39_003356 [Novosphingobium fluoreni]|uniref:Antitoxin Xre-like helix-turn-helix domain-containing protein n=1 Tax=Novosphingobium fluoreni TaxID=1391222 RepID=A0A7W6C3W0_9SPHN|nr:hypothetical protein [Novosphingobium fluoreni]
MATAAHPAAPSKALDHKDLTGSAPRTFFRIIESWALKEAEQMKLLGRDSRSTFLTFKRGTAASIHKDALKRISYVIKGLQMLLSRTADAWGPQAQYHVALRRPSGDRADDFAQFRRLLHGAPSYRDPTRLMHNPLTAHVRWRPSYRIVASCFSADPAVRRRR